MSSYWLLSGKLAICPSQAITVTPSEDSVLSSATAGVDSSVGWLISSVGAASSSSSSWASLMGSVPPIGVGVTIPTCTDPHPKDTKINKATHTNKYNL
jgi:hypothetical protein